MAEIDLNSVLADVSNNIFVEHMEPEEEKAVFAEFRATEDSDRKRELRDYIVYKNLALVAYVIHTLSVNDRMREDAQQDGIVGLITAVDKFDPERDVKFSTYAMFWIRQSIFRAYGNTANTIRYPIYQRKFIRQIYMFENEYVLAHGHSPSADEIAEAVGVSRDAVVSMRRTQNILSLDSHVHSGDGEDDTEFSHFIPSEMDVEGETVDRIANEETRAELEAVMDRVLTARERDVIRYRFGMDGERLTLDALGRKHGVTRERIRQVEKIALRKLQRNRRIRALARETAE